MFVRFVRAFLFAYWGLMGSLVAFPWSSGFVFWRSFASCVSGGREGRVGFVHYTTLVQ